MRKSWYSLPFLLLASCGAGQLEDTTVQQDQSALQIPVRGAPDSRPPDLPLARTVRFG